jgi:signal transduction histidine kinase
VDPLAREKEIAIETDIPLDLCVTGFAEDLARVFLNLFANAIRFTPSSGRIRLSAQVVSQARATSVRIDLTDTGPGIAADDLPHIFEPFYRGGGSRSRTDGGSGLGLAIARDIVVAHGGSLDVVSALGKGSTFTVRLAALPCQVPEGVAASRRPRPGRRPRKV